jgi:hypothetical protein
MEELPLKASENTAIGAEELDIKQIEEFQQLRFGDVPFVLVDVTNDGRYQLFYRSVHAFESLCPGNRPNSTV